MYRVLLPLCALSLFWAHFASGGESLNLIAEARCGVFALCVCAQSVGKQTSDEELGRLLPNQGSDASMDELEAAARGIGLTTVALEWKDKPIPFDVGSTPAIIPVVTTAGKRHFVAVLASRRDQLYVMDFPAPAKWTLTSDLRNRSKWNGQALHVSSNSANLKPLTSRLPFWPEKLFFGVLVAIVLYFAIRSVSYGIPARNRGDAN